MTAETVWEYRFTQENREHVVTFAEKPLHWEDSPIVLNPYRLNEYDAKDTGMVIADALNVHEATGLTPSHLQALVAELEASSLNYFEERNQARETVQRYRSETESLRAVLSALVREYEGYFEGAPEPQSLIDAHQVLDQ